MSDLRLDAHQPIRTPPMSDWVCYMFGNRPGGFGIQYQPIEGRVPNAFVRFMMRVCFDCLWVRTKAPPP